MTDRRLAEAEKIIRQLIRPVSKTGDFCLGEYADICYTKKSKECRICKGAYDYCKKYNIKKYNRKKGEK
jgi:hypothetical protein